MVTVRDLLVGGVGFGRTGLRPKEYSFTDLDNKHVHCKHKGTHVHVHVVFI